MTLATLSGRGEAPPEEPSVWSTQSPASTLQFPATEVSREGNVPLHSTNSLLFTRTMVDSVEKGHIGSITLIAGVFRR